MITKVSTRHFKRFEEESFELSEHLVLAGPNNSGKTTLLQAIATWSLALQRWQERHSTNEPSEQEEPMGFLIGRKDFTSFPLTDMRQLWTLSKTFKNTELEQGLKQKHSLVMTITVEGKSNSKEWKVTFEFHYSSSEQIYVRPSAESIADLPVAVAGFRLVHVPPFSLSTSTARVLRTPLYYMSVFAGNTKGQR